MRALFTGEIWKTIVGCNGNYEVSNLGRVRSAKPGINTNIGLILKPYQCKAYSSVPVRFCSGKGSQLVHILVAVAFIGPCPKGKEVNHKDLNKQNNRATNLEYVTHQQNIDHAIQNGVWPSGDSHWTHRHPEKVLWGSRNGASKLRDGDREKICRLYTSGNYTQWDLAHKFGITQARVWKILHS